MPQSPINEDQPIPKYAARPPRHFLNVTLRGLPELNYFNSEEERQRALQEIANEARKLRSGGFWVAIVLLVFSATAAIFLAGWLLSHVQWHHEVEDLLRVLAMIGVAYFVLRRLHRWGAAGDLRRKLLAAGVPVCLKCGYLLRGLPLEPGRCPECGTPFSEEAKALLAHSSPGGRTNLAKGL